MVSKFISRHLMVFMAIVNVCFIPITRGQSTFSAKGQIVNVLGLMGHAVPVITI